jgi:hypothetical protein
MKGFLTTIFLLDDGRGCPKTYTVKNFSIPEDDLLTTFGNGSGGEEGTGDQSNIAAPTNQSS